MRVSDVKLGKFLSDRANFAGDRKVDRAEFDIRRSKKNSTMTLVLFSHTGPLLRAAWEMTDEDPLYGR